MNTVNGVSNDGLGLVNNSPESFSGHTSSQEFEPSSPSKDDDISNEVCALCNCGYEMTLILGQLTRYRVSQSTLKKSDKNKYDTPKEETEIYSSDSLNNRKDTKEKVFHKRRRRKQSIDADLNLPPDMTAFGTATMQEFADVLDNDGFVWAHHCCAAWSAGVCQTDSYDLENVDKAIAKALLKKCSHCLRYGASVECQVQRCSKLFHYPCCASAGAFQNITSMILLCPEHLDRSEKLVDAEAFCDTCQKSDNMQSQLFCTSCGRHFHSYCVDMNIPITPVVRMGWQCSFCKVCQGCKQPGDEEKMLCCDQCDKGYHIYCLNPPISVVPKSVWKCVSCRKCSDCGSSKPGSGPSCRWHNNFSLCDRCYQQRKKGQSCPICKRAVRLFNNGDAIQCKKCFKCVHGECHSPLDDGAEYICPDCIEEDKDINADSYENESNSWYDQEFLSSGQKVVSIEEAELFSLAASMNFIDSCLQLDNDNKVYSGDEQKFDGKESESTLDSPYSSSLISDSYQSAQSFRGRGRGHEQKMRTFKKSFRGRGHFSRNPNYTKDSQITSQDTEKEEKDLSNIVKYSDKAENGTRTEEDEENEVVGLHSTVVIVSTRDSFTLKQDICMCCGSLGKGSEGYLIGCVQCGQCFHPFCVNVMINEVILTRGWRCLDCSVCEGCGRNSDEGHLLLCDICDISFHTYCLDPPLEEVPIGGWKCQWCVVCEDCGSKDAGFDNLWMANYTQCGPCSSEQYCSICSYAYEANNLVIQCEKCNRWLHGECDGLYTEEDVELACNLIYHCIRCRPKTKHLGIYTNLKASTISKVSIKKAISCQNQIQRKTKPLVSLKAKKLSRSELKEQKRIELEAMPLIPQHAEINECGTFAIDLSNLKARLRMDDIEKPNFHLTETGLKEIKTQVIRAPIHRSNLRKERNISRKREETKNNSIMNEEVSCSIDPEDPSASVLGASFDLEGLGVENDLLSPGMLSVKQEDLDMDLMQPDTTQELDDFLNDEENEENVFAPEPEDVNDPFEFFGVNLLEKHLNMELESLETSTNSKQLKKEKKKERRMKRAAKLAEAARIAFDTMRGPSVTDPNAMTIPLQKKPELVETLDLITPEMNPQLMITELEQPASDVKVEEELENKTPSSPVDIAAVPSSNLSPNHPISLDQNEDSSHLELMSVLDLPHVAGHEVEQMFAGLEQEMNSNKFITNKMSKSDIPSRMILSSLSSSGMPQPGLENQIKYSPSLLMSNISPHSSNLIQNIYPMDNDFEGKKSDGNGLNPKIDTQKQLRKWEIDEQLGENATISPVLYTNLMHKNLKNDFIDWPNRARAIARLWRKLPNEQREPFRIRARDNRVKLKERKGIRRHASRESPMTQNPQLQNSSLHDSQHNSQMKNSSMITSSFQNLQQNKNLHVSMPTMQMCNRFDDGEIIGSPKYSVSNSLSPTGLTTSLQANIRSGFTESPVASNISTPPSIFTVPEPQKLSPLLQRLSPHCAISSNNDLSPQLANTPTHANISSATEPTKIIIKSDSKIQLPSHKQEHYQQPIENALQEPDKKFQPLQQKRVFEQQKQTLQKDEIISKAEQKETLCLSQRDDTQTISTQSNISSRNRALNDNRNKSPLSNVNITSRIMKSPAIVSPPDSSVSNHDSDRNADIERYFNSRKNLDYSGSQMHNVDQQQAYMLQQQYMVAQQQYIQLQLAQQSTAPDGMYGIQKQPDKDLPDVDNEHEHQERLRFLFHQRQKEPSFGPQTMTPIKNTLANQDSLTHHYDPMHGQGSSIMGGNYMPRLPHFPVPNPADSPAYHQMVVEYMERYRKSLEMDTAGPPLSQVNSTMMAEFTKQYQQHHYNKYYHSRPHQSYFNFSPRPDYPNYDERMYTGYAEKGPHDYQQAFPRSNILPNKSQSVIIDEKNRGYGTATTLQRSSSFQISRIAADSTSNDEFLPGKEKDSEQKNCNISHKNDSNESEISSSKATDGLVDNEGSITSNREHYGSDDEDDIFNRNQNKPFMKRSNRAENELKKINERLLKKVSVMLSDDEEAFLGRNQDEYISDCSSHVCSDSEEEILRVSNKKLCSDHKKDENEFGNNKKTDIVHQNEQEILGRGTSLRVNETYIRDQQIAENHNSEEFKHHLYHNEKGTVQSSSFPSTDKYTIEQPGLTNGGSLSRLQNNHIPLFTNNQPTSYLSNNLYSSQNSYPHPSVYQLGVMGYPNEGNDKHFESRQHSALKNESQPDWGSFSGSNKNNYQKAGVLHQSQTKYSGFSSPSQNYNAESVSTSETLKTSFSHFHSKSSLPQSVSSVSSASNPSFSNSPDSSYFSPTITSSANNSINSDKATVSFSTTTSSNIYSTCHPNSMEISGNSMFQQGSISGSMQFPSSGIVNPHYSNPNGPYIPQSTNPLFPESGMAPFTQSSSLPPLSSSITSNPSLIQSSPIPGSVPQSSSPFKINSSPQKSNIVSLHPNSQRYHQIFFYQHQLLIMQFQQYQFQLQLQFQQLNQQQIGQQQQFLLQQQFHQQLMLLQQQLVQQQNQLYRMAANGIQFTEHQLNAMYQQQMLTQQSYSQWIVALSPEQQVLFQQRMQACMQQVQHQMAQILQQSSRKEEEQKKKPKPRRSLNKKKSAALLAADSVQTSQPSTKFPVPELSEEMKIRTGQNLVVSKEESSHSEPNQITSKPDSILPTNSVSSDSKPNQQNTCKPKTEEKTINPNIISPQYEKIHESFIRHQKQFRGEIPPGPSPLSGYSRCDTQPGQDFQRTQQNDISKPVTTVLSGEISPGSMHQKAEQLLNPRNTAIPPKPSFFPTHPSKLFKQATEKCEKSPSQESLVSNAILPMGETPSFGSRPGINQLSSEPSRIRNPFLNTKTGESSPSNNSAFSVSNLLGTPKKQSLVSTNSQPLFEPAKKAIITSEHLSVSQVIKQNDSDPGTNSPNDLACDNMYHMTDGETEKYEGMNTQLKNLIKLHNKKKDKILEEKKRLRELERIKKKEEKEKIKVIREQRKAEKYQQRLLKQKALQEAKAQQLVIKKHNKKIIVPLEIPDMPSGSKTPTIVSPLSSFTPKTPPMVVTPKIPLCEPDVHLVCPLVQPYGFNSSNTFKITGKFGYALIENVIDVYNEKPYTTSPIATSSFLKPISQCSVVVNDILNDVSLFPSPEPNNESSLMHSDIQKDKLLGSIVKEESESVRTISSTQNIMNFKDEDVDSEIEDTISRCNLCYGLLHNVVFYVDKNMENVTECMYDKFELMSSEQLAFCSNECVEAYQRKVDYTFENDDQELIDAVKVSSMVTTDELHVFLPLPSDEIRGDVCASGMSNKLVSKSNCRWKRWRVSSDNEKKTKIKSVKEDINQLMKKYSVALKPSESIRDRRQCCFCLVVGDGEANQSSRLLNCNVDSWVHLNCALWSSEVYESLNGGLHNVDKALARSKQMRCSYCSKIGATLNCSYTFGAQQRLHCEKSFHFHCALQSHAALYKDKTILCSEHKSLGIRKEELDSYAVQRKVYIERNITEQIARMLSLNNSFERKEYTFRVGNLIFHELGHVPMQLLDNFSSKDFVYPVGFETTSIFWDNHDIQKRRYYTCSISECMKSPRFKVKAHSNGSEGSLYTSSTAKGAINEIIANIQKLREKENCLKVFPEFICGEDFFGLSEPTIQRMIESLPGIDTISNYNFRFGRTPILIAELPLALNPTGCIRTEKCRKHHTKPLAMRTAAEHTHTSDAIITDDSWLVYSQRNVHIMNTKTGQYRRMRQEWRNSVVLGRSRIQGLGLFTKKDIEENTFIIEYIGSLIRNEVANRLEKHYERQNRGIYMFRIDNDTVVDATMAGGPARYINHSCDPNCVAEIVSIEKEKRIIIISSRKIDKGEELTYDYKFELEDDSEKIACLCGSFNCRKWMN
ncbi:uncharacterized protein LOC100209023 isoform X1 [Hydra vulgaris]|uniref:uncharacterized protein LOC100209023 isoform X1 n=1 Tax=Hydra vulgaris TaxID=6087 RepID=UPI0006414D2A|nr:uncharacterized protein LOC100209023 [Hydra vulgaris]